MKSLFKIMLVLLLVLNCNEEPKQVFNINAEPLSVNAEAKTVSWVGYRSFSFGLRDMVDNFSKDYVVDNANKLVSASQSVLYSMPNDLREEIMNEKASRLVKATQNMANTIQDKSEATIKEELNKVIKMYTKLNEEINYRVKE